MAGVSTGDVLATDGLIPLALDTLLTHEPKVVGQPGILSSCYGLREEWVWQSKFEKRSGLVSPH